MRELWALLIGLAFFCLHARDNLGAEPQLRFNLLTLPGARGAAQRLAAPAQIAYENGTLRASLSQLAEHYQFSYWIDRRVDADKLISLTLREANVGKCLLALAKLSGAEVGLVENIVTIAPPDRLAAMQYTAVRLHDQLSQASPAAGKQAQLRPLEWPMLTTPEELAAEITSAWGIHLQVSLPHDLMNAGRLQPCTVATQLTLLLGGFDQCAVGKSLDQLRIVPLPSAAPWQAEYHQAAFRAERLSNWKTILAQFPDARVERQGSQVNVVGTTAAHLRLLEPSESVPATDAQARSQPRTGSKNRDSRPSTDPLAEQRITFPLVTDQPIGSVIGAMARQMGFEVHWDSSLTSAHKMSLVTLEAKGETLDAILGRLAAQSRLMIVRSGAVVTISPRSP